MSGKKKQSNKKKAVEKKIAKEEPKRKLIPFTAGKLPSVSKSMPQAANAVPLVSKEVPLVSKPVSLVSAKPNISIPRYWEKISSNKKWNMSSIQVTRKRKVRRPKDIGVFKALNGTIISPVMGTMKMVKGIASAFRAQAEEEREPKNPRSLFLLITFWPFRFLTWHLLG